MDTTSIIKKGMKPEHAKLVVQRWKKLEDEFAKIFNGKKNSLINNE